MLLKQNFLKNKLLDGRSVLGTWSVIPSPYVAEILSCSGLDFIILDREHGSISFETIQTSILACENYQVSPFIRVSSLNATEIQKALDCGAHGIHIPNIETSSQLDEIAEYALYPPQGSRGFSPFTRACRYSAMNSKEQLNTANAQILITVHLEGKKPFEHLDTLLSHPAVDIFFVGLYDLSKSLGIPGNITHPDILHLLEHIAKKVQEVGKTLGTIVSSQRERALFLNMGIRYITYSSDCDMLLQSFSSLKQEEVWT